MTTATRTPIGNVTMGNGAAVHVGINNEWGDATLCNGWGFTSGGSRYAKIRNSPFAVTCKRCLKIQAAQEAEAAVEAPAVEAPAVEAPAVEAVQTHSDPLMPALQKYFAPRATDATATPEGAIDMTTLTANWTYPRNENEARASWLGYEGSWKKGPSAWWVSNAERMEDGTPRFAIHRTSATAWNVYAAADWATPVAVAATFGEARRVARYELLKMLVAA